MSRKWCFILVFGAVFVGTQIPRLVVFVPAGPSAPFVLPLSQLADSPPPPPHAPPTSDDPAETPLASKESPEPKAPVQSGPRQGARQGIVNLYQSGKLFRREHYHQVRAAFAGQFAQEHDDKIREGLGPDCDKILAWLERRPVFKEDLFTALDQDHDKLVSAFGVLRRLWLWSAEQVEANPDLAIATVVVWDVDTVALGDAQRHCLRPNARVTGPGVEALGNFQYLVNHAHELNLQLKILPWEILTFLVDHRTPLLERDWARSYVRQNPRANWYLDVPYDFDLMKNILQPSGTGTPAKLNGRDYSLNNIRTYGGVCGQRADFAARVGKSVGVPSAYCEKNGSAAKPGHAWSAHLRVVSVWGERVDIRCEFVGRLEYPTGIVLDPHFHQNIGDRDLERRWWAVCQDRVGKRQALLAMRAYSWLKDELPFDGKEKIAFLERCLQLNCYDEGAWLELGRMAGAGEIAASTMPPILKERIAELTYNAARFPDFVLARYDSLLGAYADPGDRIHHYSYALQLCEKQGRADLAVEVRKKITALQNSR